MLYAADVGHAYFKGYGNGKRVIFPAVLGEIRNPVFEKNGDLQIETMDGKWAIGESALLQSVNKVFGQDKDWIKKPGWKALLLTGISEVFSPETHYISIDLVSGLPINDFYLKDEISKFLKGNHTIKRPERRNLTIEIKDILFIPQGLAAYGSPIQDDETLVVLDLGGRNINYTTFRGKHAISKQSGSTETGMLNTARQVAKRVKEELRIGIDIYPHDAIQIMKIGIAKNAGKKHNVTNIINDELKTYTDSVFTLISSIWGDTSGVDYISIVGGGALIVGDRIKKMYSQALVADDPQWANINGYLKFGKLRFGTN